VKDALTMIGKTQLKKQLKKTISAASSEHTPLVALFYCHHAPFMK